MLSTIVLRPITAQDFPFLLNVYASTRPDVLGLPWDDLQKSAFLSMQFRAQHQHYQTHFPAAEYSVIQNAQNAIGRLYIDRRPNDIHILDITLLPEHRGSGIGAALLQKLQDEGTGSRKSVSLFVEHENVARNLYSRLGFVPGEVEGVYQLMKWTPPAT